MQASGVCNPGSNPGIPTIINSKGQNHSILLFEYIENGGIRHLFNALKI